MIACPRCGTENAESTRACSLCGTNLGDASPEAAAGQKRPDFGRTLLGQGPVVPTVSGSKAPVPAGPGIGRGTIMGMGVPTPVPAQATPPSPVPPAPPEPPPQTVPHPAPAQGAGGLGHRTVMGLAPPPPVPPAQPVGLGGTVVMQPAQQTPKTLAGLAAPEPVHPAAPPTPEPPAADAGVKPPTKTILGVARPGIAPLNPGMQKLGATETFPSPPPPPPLLPELGPYEEPPSSVAPQRRSSLLAILVIVAAIVLLAGAGAALYFLRGPGTIEAKAGLDADGHERLDLSCPTCKDGTSVKLGASESSFRGGRAELKVPGGLKVGDNPFELEVTQPGSKRASRISLSVPLEFRVRADTTPLAESPPKLAIAIEALPGSLVFVDDKPVPLPASGKTRYDLDVVAELTGLDTSVRRLERKARYAISAPGRPPEKGEVTFQMGIVPLALDAPGPSITIETSTFLLAGRTQKGATVSVSNRPINTDADGRYEQTMSVSTPGETVVTVRTSIADSAPRLYGFKVKRVNSLRDEARARRAGAIASYSALVAELDKKSNAAVALDGSVLELSATGHSTLLLLDMKAGCAKAPCLTRVLHGAKLALALGDAVSVFGNLRGSVEGAHSGTRVPEVFADFVLKGRR